MDSGSCDELYGEQHGHEPVDGGAERRPPARVGNIVAAVLPEVLEAMGRVAKDEEPARPGDACRGKQDERARAKTSSGVNAARLMPCPDKNLARFTTSNA
jgi:hypothetical protein